MSIFATIAEQRIADAKERGAFDNLEGAGRPLELEDDSMIPQDLRMAYKVLKNAGYLPPEAQDMKDATTIIEMLQGNVDEQTRYRQMQKLQTIFTRMRDRGHHATALNMENEYYDKIVKRITISKRSA